MEIQLWPYNRSVYKIYGTAVATGTCGGWSGAVEAVRAEGCGDG